MCANAYILAGGHSSRFGSDKAHALLHGIPLISHLANILRSRGHEVVVVGRDSKQYENLNLMTIPDIEPDLGPIGGLETALDHRLRTSGTGWALLLSCDLLNPTALMLNALDASRKESPQAEAIAFGDDRWQPFPGLYHTRLREQIYNDPPRSMQQLLTCAQTVAIKAPQRIHQANTPADLRAYEESTRV